MTNEILATISLFVVAGVIAVIFRFWATLFVRAQVWKTSKNVREEVEDEYFIQNELLDVRDKSLIEREIYLNELRGSLEQTRKDIGMLRRGVTIDRANLTRDQDKFIDREEALAEQIKKHELNKAHLLKKAKELKKQRDDNMTLAGLLEGKKGMLETTIEMFRRETVNSIDRFHSMGSRQEDLDRREEYLLSFCEILQGMTDFAQERQPDAKAGAKIINLLTFITHFSMMRNNGMSAKEIIRKFACEDGSRITLEDP